MGRPKSVTESQPQRTTSVTWASVSEKQFWQDYAKRRGITLPGLIKLLLTQDFEQHPPAAPAA